MPKVTDAHRAQRREQILTAAMRCAAREGFHKTTMNAVIRESGLSAGAVYLYFASKRDLIHAVAATAPVPPPEEALRQATSRLVDLGGSHGVDLSRVALQAWAEAARDPAVLEILGDVFSRIRAAWTDYAVAAVAAGHLAAETDPGDAARVLMGSLPGFMLLRLLDPGTTPEQYAAGLAALRRPGTHQPS